MLAVSLLPWSISLLAPSFGPFSWAISGIWEQFFGRTRLVLRPLSSAMSMLLTIGVGALVMSGAAQDLGADAQRQRSSQPADVKDPIGALLRQPNAVRDRARSIAVTRGQRP